MKVYKLYVFCFTSRFDIDDFILLTYEHIGLGVVEKTVTYDEIMDMKNVGYSKKADEVGHGHWDIYINMNYKQGGHYFSTLSARLTEKLREDRINKIIQ